MRRSVSFALLGSLVFAACFPGFAQKVQFNKELVKKVTTSFARVAPLTDGNGVLIQW